MSADAAAGRPAKRSNWGTAGSRWWPKLRAWGSGRFAVGVKNCATRRRRLKVAGIGRVAVRWHRQVPGQIKTLRLTRQAGKWYAVLAWEVAAEPLPATGVDVGIDVGLTSLIATSEGEHVEHPAWYRRAQKRL